MDVNGNIGIKRYLRSASCSSISKDNEKISRRNISQRSVLTRKRTVKPESVPNLNTSSRSFTKNSSKSSSATIGDSSNQITGSRQTNDRLSTIIKTFDGHEINYQSSYLQPVVRVARIERDEIEEYLFPKNSKNPQCSTVKPLISVSPIRFDHEESFIREISPQTANKAFAKVTIF